MWYYNQYIEDQESNFISSRNFVEYNASFTNPEAVSKIKEARDKAIIVSDKSFNAGLETFFGRSIEEHKPDNAKNNTTKVDLKNVISAYNKINKKNDNKAVVDYKHWLDSKLE